MSEGYNYRGRRREKGGRDAPGECISSVTDFPGPWQRGWAKWVPHQLQLPSQVS